MRRQLAGNTKIDAPAGSAREAISSPQSDINILSDKTSNLKQESFSVSLLHSLKKQQRKCFPARKVQVAQLMPACQESQLYMQLQKLQQTKTHIHTP